MVPHVQSSTNCGLGCFKNKTKFFLCTNSHFLSGLTTAQAVDPLSVYRDFPVLRVDYKKRSTKGVHVRLLAVFKNYFQIPTYFLVQTV
jgi:hypothetical protein